MSTGLNFLIETKRRINNRRGASRSLFEASMNFLLEADPAGDPASGEEDTKTDAEIEKMMPKAVSNTVSAFKSLASVAGMPEDTKKVFNVIAKKLAGYTTEPDSEEAVQSFKTAEEFHAIVVMILDGMATQAASYVKSGGDVDNVFNDYNKIKQKAFSSAQAKIDGQIEKLPFLQKIAAKFKSKKIDERLKELAGDYQSALEGIRNIVPVGSGRDSANVLFDIVKDPKFKEQRTVQGNVVSQAPVVPDDDKKGKEEKQAKFDKVKSRIEDYKKSFEWLLKKKQINDTGYSVFETIADDIGDATNVEDFEKNLGKQQKEMLTKLMSDAEDNFGELRATLKSIARSGGEAAPGSSDKKAGGSEGSGGEGGGTGDKSEPTPPEGEATSLRSMLFQKNSNKKRTKLDPKASGVKTALDDLSQAWQAYNSDPKKLGGKDQSNLMKKLAAAQDALKGVKLEGKQNDEDVIVERWQRMAGIL